MKKSMLLGVLTIWVLLGVSDKRAWAQGESEQPKVDTGLPTVPLGEIADDPGASTSAQARISFSAEYLLWWMSQRPLPANLVTTGTVVTGNPLTSSGPIGNPGTRTLFGGSQDGGSFSGVRLTGIMWLDRCGCVGVQASGFLLAQRSDTFTATSNAAGTPILARPIVDVLNNQQSANLIAYPGAFAGGIAITSTTRLWGAEGNLVARPGCAECSGLQWLVGFRHLNLQESLDFQQNTTILPNGGAAFNGARLRVGDTVLLTDSFRTRNQFYGGQVGTQGEWCLGAWQLGLTAKLAIGDNHEVVDPQGTSLLFVPGKANAVAAAQGGALALRTNIGPVSKDRFAVIPEVALKAGYRITPRLTGFVGYSFLYCSDVVRPGDQVNQNVNVSHVPTSLLFNQANAIAQPGPLFRHSDLWVHGVNLGFEFRF